VIPTTSYPSSRRRAAVTDESTPPDMATTTRVSAGRFGMPSEFEDKFRGEFMGRNIGDACDGANNSRALLA
jgi:hypothetical protein